MFIQTVVFFLSTFTRLIFLSFHTVNKSISQLHRLPEASLVQQDLSTRFSASSNAAVESPAETNSNCDCYFVTESDSRVRLCGYNRMLTTCITHDLQCWMWWWLASPDRGTGGFWSLTKCYPPAGEDCSWTSIHNQSAMDKLTAMHHSPRRADTSSHAGLVCRAGEVEQVGFTGALAGHTPPQQEAILPLWAVLVKLTRRTQPVCKKQRSRHKSARCYKEGSSVWSFVVIIKKQTNALS